MSPQMKQFLTLAAGDMGKSRLIELRAWSSLQRQGLDRDGVMDYSKE